MAERRTAAADRRPLRSGPGRVLVAVYGIFALAATGRAAVQASTKFHEAPLAYLLSALAAAVYVVATVALARGDRTSGRVAVVSCSVEPARRARRRHPVPRRQQGLPRPDGVVGVRAGLRLRAAGAAGARPPLAAPHPAPNP
ncbi:hypothetical protein GCM10025868_23730 [Angustibacter aerolatus]|uniref:Integral membrane protein n=1 Tax=Angustibacter aerolatus TaxID=1162965 RepID=A0ABQ6JIA2_9ACTN|nr:hypothetical protein [Angustibacter aerolatus]GMA87123.1 hypothetical protein GCM10025868_23730 [Angustibacter aerolatus]